MLTDDKSITTPEYWKSLYEGERNNAKVDSSNNKVPEKRFDRFGWVAKYAEGPNILGIASGHAHIEKRIKAMHKDWTVIASDQTEAAAKAAHYMPYELINAYEIPFKSKTFESIIVAQALEYMEFPDQALTEFKRVAKYFLCTLPIGNMTKWSQLRVYTEDNFREFIEKYGTIEVWEREADLLLCKIKFHV